MILKPEKNKTLYVAFLAMLASTPPLSTDMYLASIPQIAESWGVGKEIINLTLVLWFASFSFFILVAGSLSDKYGRKPVLVTGLFIFVSSSFMCALAQNPVQLIVFRILQGAGAGAPSSIVMAIIRDKFDGRERQRAMAYVMTIVALAPMVAPMIGAMLLEFFSWRVIFAAQGAMVALTFVLSFAFEETIGDKLRVSVYKLASRYTVHFKNRNFMFASLSMGLLATPFYGFIAFSPVYYISIFGLSEKLFSVLFGVNAVFLMAGARTSTFFVRKYGERKVITASIIGCAAGGLGIMLLAPFHYLFFTLFMIVFSYFSGISRPVSGSIIVGLVDTDVGSASSFFVFYQFMTGALCMAVITLPWSHPVLFYGMLTTGMSLVVMFLWQKIASFIDLESQC